MLNMSTYGYEEFDDHYINHLGKYNSDSNVMEQTITSLVNNPFSHSPPGW